MLDDWGQNTLLKSILLRRWRSVLCWCLAESVLLGLCFKPAVARLVEATYPPGRPVAPTAQAPHEVWPSPAPARSCVGVGCSGGPKPTWDLPINHLTGRWSLPLALILVIPSHQVTCKLNSSGLTAEPGDILASLFFHNHVFIAVLLYLVFYLHMKKSWFFFQRKTYSPGIIPHRGYKAL